MKLLRIVTKKKGGRTAYEERGIRKPFNPQEQMPCCNQRPKNKE